MGKHAIVEPAAGGRVNRFGPGWWRGGDTTTAAATATAQARQRMNIERMRADLHRWGVGPSATCAAKPGDVEVLLSRLEHVPDGSADYAAAVDALAAYGAYLQRSGDAIRRQASRPARHAAFA